MLFARGRKNETVIEGSKDGAVFRAQTVSDLVRRRRAARSNRDEIRRSFDSLEHRHTGRSVLPLRLRAA